MTTDLESVRNEAATLVTGCRRLVGLLEQARGPAGVIRAGEQGRFYMLDKALADAGDALASLERVARRLW